MEQQNQSMSTDEDMGASVAPLASSNNTIINNNTKRSYEDQDVEMKDDTRCTTSSRCAKKARVEPPPSTLPLPTPAAAATTKAMTMKKAPVPRTLRPAPFFLYKDHSAEPDPDPLTPLTAPGRVPNFPAKMHAILSRKDYADVVAWLPHGRSWRVLKPREFEIKILPKFFEHAKFSSFVRQANGWGFRRITQGRDRNSYYHEKFLRGLPHLSKGMMRPKVAEKLTADPSQEPDFYKISELHPLPEKTEDDEAILLQCTLQGGPRARVPIYSGAMGMGALSAAALPKMIPQSAVASDSSIKPAAQPAATAASVGVVAPVPMTMAAQSQPQPTPPAAMPFPAAAYLSTPLPPQAMLPGMGAAAAQPAAASTFAAIASANQLSMQAAALNATAASQFAAGFAAATAFSQHQLQNILGNLAVQQHQQQQQQQHQQQHQHQQPQSGAHNGVQNPTNFGFPACGFR